MGLSRRGGNRFSASIWPGFVDAMSALLLVLMFVLSIFMIVQSVLREQITTQDHELEGLTQQVASLTDALGLSRGRVTALEGQVTGLNADLDALRATSRQQEAAIAALGRDLAARNADLQDARTRITSFEAQVAALIAERTDLGARLADTEARRDAPALEQVVLRVGTVLGRGTDNQITALFRRKRLLAVAGSDSPFVFIWTQDLARILHRAATDGPAGIFNVAGDGAMGIDDIAQALGKPVLRLPAWALKAALGVARPLRLSRYGPEQVGFLQYRPVLANDALKRDFGYVPEMTSAEAFDLWRRWARL